MILRIALIALFTTLIFFSCGKTQDHSHDHDQEETTTDVEKEESKSLQLDEGKRWVANPETTEGVNNMIEILNTYPLEESTESYLVLRDSLKGEFNMIFDKCTMKGEAHNQLHNFLYPMIDLFERLSSNDSDERKAGYSDFKKHLTVYQEYFE